MGAQFAPHKTTTEEGSVYLMTDAAGDEVHVGRIGRDPNESDQVAGQRWDAFTRLLFRYGVEPTTDEPTFTTVTDGQTVEHFVLQELGANL